MSFRKPYQFLLLSGIQLGGLGLLFWAIGAILPVVIHTLMKGMLHWTIAGIIYSWIIQLGFVLILLSIRRFLVPVVLEWIENLPVFYLRIVWCLLCLGSLTVLWRLFRLLASATTELNYFVMGEWAFVIIQLYLLAGIAAPLCSVEGYQLLFKGRNITVPKQNKKIASSPVLLPAKRATMQRPLRRGYPGWIWPVLWFLFWVLLDWVGCTE